MSQGERVFHHSEASRLDIPDRLTWLPPSDVITALQLRPGMTVADIGAGTGYFSIPFASVVGQRGHVWAVDLQKEMLVILGGKPGVKSMPITLQHGDAARTALDEHSCDLAFYSNVWHEIDDLQGALWEARRIVAPGGRIAIVDWRKDAAVPPGPPADHRIAMGDVLRSLTADGWAGVTGKPLGMYSYLVTGTASR
jgi:ubiquinone/menaquinone biosynthesis C-methylase UbiE